MALKEKIMEALAGATSQKPLDIEAMYAFGEPEQVEATLLEMYHAFEVGCCLRTVHPQLNGEKGKRASQGVTSSVWWPVGKPRALPEYGEGVIGQVNRNRNVKGKFL